MVRVLGPTGVVSAAALLAALAEAAAPAGISLELHRLPDAVVSRHASIQRQRRLERASEDFESVPLHLGMGTHYTWVYAGTPPQRASVITDTGSSIMAFPCAGCDGCGKHTDEPFVASNSSTLTHVTCSDPSFFRCQGCGGPDSSKKTCEISQSYMEGSSWHASVVEDIVYLGGEDSFHDTAMRNTYGTHFKFGCQNSETGLFITQVADGIMGLANNNNHIVAKLYNEKKIPNKQFSLCFAAEGGAMSIGAPDTSRHKGNITYAKLVKTLSHDFYGVELRDVRVAGIPVEASKTTFQYGQYIVDSGTTDSYLPSSMKKAFQEAFKTASGLDYHVSSSSCVGYTDEQLEKLPNVEFILGAEDGGNLTLVVTPDQYLLQEATGKYCSSIFLSEASGGVIGANIMMDHDVIFDQENQRVGFVEADCDFKRQPAPEVTNPGNGTTAPISASPAATAEVVSTTPVTSETQTPAPSSTESPSKEPTATPSSAPASSTAHPIASKEPTATPSSTPVSSSAHPADESPSPSSTLESNATGKLTSTPPATTEAPAPEETHTTAAPTSETPVSTSVSTMGAPTSEVPAANLDLKTVTDHTSDGEDTSPIVPIVGTVLVVAFVLAAAVSARRRKRAKRDRKYGRVKETEGEDDDDDDDDEDDLIAHTPGQRKSKKLKTSEFEDDDDAVDNDEDRKARRLEEDDDDDDDDIFDRDVDDRDVRKHDARMLEQL